jgi:hypothetical protein
VFETEKEKKEKKKKKAYNSMIKKIMETKYPIETTHRTLL